MTIVVVGEEFSIRERGSFFTDEDSVGVEFKHLVDTDMFLCLDGGDGQWVLDSRGHGRSVKFMIGWVLFKADMLS